MCEGANSQTEKSLRAYRTLRKVGQQSAVRQYLRCEHIPSQGVLVVPFVIARCNVNGIILVPRKSRRRNELNECEKLSARALMLIFIIRIHVVCVDN